MVELANACRDIDIRFAILSDSRHIRGVVTAVAWLGVELRAFEPGQHRHAAEYLQLTAAELATALEVLMELRRAHDL